MAIEASHRDTILRRRVLFVGSALTVLAACRQGPATEPGPPAASGAGAARPATVLVAAPQPSAEPSSSAAAIASAVPAASSGSTAAGPAPKIERTYCKQDTGCGWDDPCMPTRCGKPSATPPACDETALPPGTCSCVDDFCTLEPSASSRQQATAAAPACSSARQCAIDRSTGVCHHLADAKDVLIKTRGPYCDCEGGRCLPKWSAPVSCRSFRDCAIERRPGLERPVRSNIRPARRLKPCEDADVTVDCVNGVCTLKHWFC